MEAIDALKQKVLSLAIQGKLVAQDPTDEPASVLLERIKAEKAELVKQGKIKKDKQESYIFRGDDNKYYEQIGSETKDITDEIPFNIPNSWEWVRIKNLCLDVFHGRSPKYSKTKTECKIIGQQANQNYGIDLSYIKYGTLDFLEQITDKEYLQKYDVLLNTLGNGTVGRSGIYLNSSPDKILTDGHIFIFRNINPTISTYFYHYMQEKKENIEKSADGTTNQTFLNLSKTIEWLIPLPPLSEQKRIVAEIERIFNQIEIVKGNQEELSKLKDGLKNKILDLAIQGKLVEQDPNDEPASELLKKIKVEKAELVKQGKIKKDKQESYIFKGTDNRHYEKIGSEIKDITEEIPFEIPNSWSWCRLGNICDIINGYAYKSSLYVEKSNNQVIRLGNVKKGRLLLNEKQVYISDEYAENTENFKIKDKDILITLTGTKEKRDYFYSVVCNLDSTSTNLYLNQRVGLLRSYKNIILPEMLQIILNGDVLLDTIFATETGTANQGNIGTNNVQNLLVSIPPIEEQKRIVEKLENVFQFIETL